MERQKKYLAIIMNRVYSKDGDFIYVANHPEIGYLDEKTHIFTDRNGNEYLSVLDGSLMMSEISEAHYGTIPLDKVIERTGTAPLREAIADYAYGSTRYVYYASSLSNNIPFVIPISLDKLRENINKAFDEAISKEKGIANDDNSTNKFSKAENLNRNSDDYKPAHAIDDDDDDNSIEKTDIQTIMKNIIDGKYSLNELRQLSSIVGEKRDDIESLLQSIDIQIEATENGESKNKIKGVKDGFRPIKTPDNYIDINKLHEKITKSLVAQDEPLRRVITEIVRKEADAAEKRMGLLLTGSTGVGKTMMMSLIAENINKPFIKVDSTKLTVPGYVGKDIEEYLWELYVKCGKDIKKAENAIIFFDEIDKKGSEKKEDIAGQGVLSVLLPFIEGGSYTACEDTKKSGESVKINTDNMIVIFGGAFTDVYKELGKNNSIGFGSDIEGKDNRIMVDDFVEKGKMLDEFMGRISIVKLNDLDIDSIKKILLESDESAIKRQERLFDKLGVKLTPGYDYINAIAKQAVDKKTGARGINSVVDETTWEAYADAYSNLGAYREIILGKETVEDPKQYKKIWRKNN